MSRAFCVKKINCNSLLGAACSAADNIVFFQIIPAMEDGEISEHTARALVDAFSANDDAYLRRHEEIVKRVMAVLDSGSGDGDGAQVDDIQVDDTQAGNDTD